MYRKVDEEPSSLDLGNEPEYLDDEDEDSWDVPDDAEVDEEAEGPDELTFLSDPLCRRRMMRTLAMDGLGTVAVVEEMDL